jgi:DNA topoisomerase-3
MELKMKAVCEGRKTRREVIEETVEQYRAVYVRTQQRLDVLRAVRHPTLETS